MGEVLCVQTTRCTLPNTLIKQLVYYLVSFILELTLCTCLPFKSERIGPTNVMFPLAGVAADLPPCPCPLGPSSEANLPTTARHLLAALASPFSFSLRQRGWPWTFQCVRVRCIGGIAAKKNPGWSEIWVSACARILSIDMLSKTGKRLRPEVSTTSCSTSSSTSESSRASACRSWGLPHVSHSKLGGGVSYLQATAAV
jgi:hypothetical protein